MLVENQTIIMKWASTNKKWYITKGYHFTKMGDEFKVNAKDLSEGTRTSVRVICDYCLENGIYTEYSKPYFKYITHRKGLNKDSCMGCRNIKQREVMFNKYGVASPAHIPEVYEKLKTAKRLDFNVIINRFENSNCTLLSHECEYENNTSKLRFICLKHKYEGEQNRSWSSISSSGCNEICNFCAIDSRTERLRSDFDVVKNTFLENNLILLENQQYVSANVKLKYICPLHKEKGIQEINYTHVSRGQGCRYCYLESKSGENCNFWNGGTTEILHYLRGCLNEWKKESLRQCNYQCVISGENYVEVHHLHSFHLIVDEIGRLLDFDVKSKICDLSDEMLKLLEEKCITLHSTYGLGICLSPKIHNHFHSVYGNKNNNKEQFIEFVENYYCDSLEKVQEIIYKKLM